jgi:hypothetical protein
MGGRGDKFAIADVRTALEQKGMKFISSASTIEKDVDSGSFIGTIEKFADTIRLIDKMGESTTPPQAAGYGGSSDITTLLSDKAKAGDTPQGAGN